MSDPTILSPHLLEPALPGSWIAAHQRIWQMTFLNANKLAGFGSDRGLPSFSQKDVIQLWQLGLLKADLILSQRKLSQIGLVHRSTDRYGDHIYSDERELPRRIRHWKNARNHLKPLRKGVELLFHPFRYYVLYHIAKELDLHISSMAMFSQDGFSRLLDWSLAYFNRWTGSEQFRTSIRKWNDIASLCIITEPCTYQRIFHSIRFDPSEVTNHHNGAKEINLHMIDYWEQHVRKLYEQIGIEALENIRQDLCYDTKQLDPNKSIHTLLCLGDSELRVELEGNLGGALLLRTMAEMLRRATQEAFTIELPEEDELGGWTPSGIKETLYGSNRLLDDQQAGGVFAGRYGLNYKPRVHCYGEGDTEYGALLSFFNKMGIPVTNLHGLIKEGKSTTGKPLGATFFRDELRADIRSQRYSLVLIDKDVKENVKVLESAARNNRTSEDDGLFGSFFLADPDFEFENFTVEELEEVLWKWVGGEPPSQEDRELLHTNVKDAKNSTEFFRGVRRTALTLPRLTGYDKGEQWGEELMKYAWEHPVRQDRVRKRQIIEAVELAIRWEKVIKMERYEVSKKSYMVDPQTGRIINRSP